jgi:hypothetical protein
VRRAVVWLCLYVIGTAPGIAHAKCGWPRPEFSPSAGVLPADPVVYFFIHGKNDDGWFMANAPMTSEVVARTEAFVVYRLTIRASRGPLHIRYRWKEPEFWPIVADYQIGAPAPNHARVTSVEHDNYSMDLLVERRRHPAE